MQLLYVCVCFAFDSIGGSDTLDATVTFIHMQRLSYEILLH